MKTLAFSIIMLFSVSQLAEAAGKKEEGAGPAERILLVKVTDRAGVTSYELMSPANFQELLKQISKEEKLSVKALALTEKAWREDESTKKKSFPRGAISPRKAISMRDFMDSSKASDALANEEKKDADHAKAEKDRQAVKDKCAIDKKTKTQAQIDKDKSKDAEKEALHRSARDLYETKLQELMAAAEGAEPAKDAKKDAKKEEPKEAVKPGK